MPKPKIKKLNKEWVLRYHYQPRSFSLFGLDQMEREEVKKYSYTEVKLFSWEEAICYLKLLYRQNLILK